MKEDITSRSDLERLIKRFYEKVNNDAQIGPFFGHVNWEKHLPVMYDFWENALFYTGSYTGNPMKLHQALHRRNPLSASDFKRWLELFYETSDELFAGCNAELLKQRAASIAAIMQLKVFGVNE